MFQAHLAMAGNQTQEKFEDTKGVIRSNKPKEDRQHNGKKKNNDLQNTTQKLKME
jgi:hypothetical protein